MALIDVEDETRDKLRVYKARHGDTYTQAIERLFEQTEWEYDE
jgi:hypothetical protein